MNTANPYQPPAPSTIASRIAWPFDVRGQLSREDIINSNRVALNSYARFVFAFTCVLYVGFLTTCFLSSGKVFPGTIVVSLIYCAFPAAALKVVGYFQVRNILKQQVSSPEPQTHWSITSELVRTSTGKAVSELRWFPAQTILSESTATLQTNCGHRLVIPRSGFNSIERWNQFVEFTKLRRTSFYTVPSPAKSDAVINSPCETTGSNGNSGDDRTTEISVEGQFSRKEAKYFIRVVKEMHEQRLSRGRKFFNVVLWIGLLLAGPTLLLSGKIDIEPERIPAALGWFSVLPIIFLTIYFGGRELSLFAARRFTRWRFSDRDLTIEFEHQKFTLNLENLNSFEETRYGLKLCFENQKDVVLIPVSLTDQATRRNIRDLITTEQKSS